MNKKFSPKMLKAALVELERDDLIKKNRIGNRDQYCLTGKETYEKFASMFNNLQEVKKSLTKKLPSDERILMLNNYIQLSLFLINGLIIFDAQHDDPEYHKTMKRMKLIEEGLEMDVQEKSMERDNLIQREKSSYPEMALHFPRLVSLEEYREFKKTLSPQQRKLKQVWRFTF